MSTSIHALVQDLDRRWDEVTVLMSIAEDLDYEDPKMIPLCKALTVLMIANLEGYLQEVIKALIADINDNSYFKRTHYNMKRTQCLQYIPDPQSNASHIKRLISKFEETDIKYDVSAFIYDRGKNPKLSIIEKLYNSVGGNNFFGYISDCEIERIFENDRTYISEQVKKLRTNILSRTRSFPYTIDIRELGINTSPQTNKKDCLWSDFLDHILKYRHFAAHGNEASPLSVLEIKVAFEKIKILELLFTALIGETAIEIDNTNMGETMGENANKR